QGSATEIIYERDVRRGRTARFRLEPLVKKRAGANARSQNPNSDHGRWRGFVRRHFDGAASTAAGYQRLHGFLHLEGEQATHDNYLFPTRLPIPRTSISPSKSLLRRCSATSFMRRSIGRESTPRLLPARSLRSRVRRLRSTKELCE